MEKRVFQTTAITSRLNYQGFTIEKMLLPFSPKCVFLEDARYKICALESISCPNSTNNSLFERGEDSSQIVSSFSGFFLKKKRFKGRYRPSKFKNICNKLKN